ncbi:MAG: globin-coupled sensor protein [bacterium]|nr:globin-coupled sensor protein [bacterium]
MQLTEKFGVDANEMEYRKGFVHLTDSDIALLQSLLPFVEEHVDGIVADFYEHLLRYPEARAFFKDEETLTRVKATQREYLLDLFRGNYDAAYFERRLQIGVVHERIGLDPKWYLGGNNNFLQIIIPLLMRRYRFRPERLCSAIQALLKVTNLDQQLVMDTYIGSMVEKLTRLGAQIRSTVQVLAPTARESAERAAAAETQAKVSLGIANEGVQIAQRTLAGMNTLLGKSKEAVEQIQNLDGQIRHIEDIADVVGEMSAQIELLAINATVVASRSGEHGKGFSVIAKEIRKLSDESKASMARVHERIRDIFKATDATVRMTSEGAQTAEEGVKQTESTDAAFRDLAASIAEAFDDVQKISANVKRQADAIGTLQSLVQTQS